MTIIRCSKVLLCTGDEGVINESCTDIWLCGRGLYSHTYGCCLLNQFNLCSMLQQQQFFVRTHSATSTVYGWVSVMTTQFLINIKIFTRTWYGWLLIKSGFQRVHPSFIVWEAQAHTIQAQDNVTFVIFCTATNTACYVCCSSVLFSVSLILAQMEQVCLFLASSLKYFVRPWRCEWQAETCLLNDVNNLVATKMFIWRRRWPGVIISVLVVVAVLVLVGAGELTGIIRITWCE